jgi:predicted alpha/beta hydrolase
MQSASDIFLGWERLKAPDGVVRDFYVRQLWDWKLSADIETMRHEVLAIYAQMCGWTLARAHARSGDAIAIGSYLGAGTRFDESMCRFASSYADQNEKDFEALKLAIATDKIHAISDV